MTSLILGLLLAAPPSPPPPVPRMEKLTRILAGEDRRDLTTGRQARTGRRRPQRAPPRRPGRGSHRRSGGGARPRRRFSRTRARGPADDGLRARPHRRSARRGSAAGRAQGSGAGRARAGPRRRSGRSATPAPRRPSRRWSWPRCPRRRPLVTVRGDDPASMTDPWLEPRLGLFALARLKDARSAAGRAPLRGQAALRLVGGDLDAPCAWRTRPCGPCSWPPSPPPIPSRAPTGRGGWARSRTPRTWTRCCRSCAIATRRSSSTPCARSPSWAKRGRCPRCPRSCARPPARCAWRR